MSGSAIASSEKKESASNEAIPRHVFTSSYADPKQLAEAGAQLSGLEYMKAVAAKQLPNCPLGDTLSFDVMEADVGLIRLKCRPGLQHYNFQGFSHGGFASAIIDGAIGYCCHTTLPAHTKYSTLEFKISFIRPISVELGEVICTARVLNKGRQIVTVFATIEDKNGKLLVHAMGTCFVQLGKAEKTHSPPATQIPSKL